MIKVLSGNKAAAYGVRLARPDVIAMYPHHSSDAFG